MRYAVLGPIRVRADDGNWRSPPGRKQRLLLAALLARAPRPASRDLLADLLWGDEPPDGAAAALQAQLFRLRAFVRAAGADAGALESVGDGYRLTATPDDVDAARFERLAASARAAAAPAAVRAADEALALWQGAPYEEFADLHHFAGEAARLRELRGGVAEHRAACLLALGSTAAALAAAEALAREDPLRERPRALLMEALYREGRQADALAAFQHFRRLLSEELGLEPSPALRQLELEIIRHEAALRAPAVPVAGASATADPTPAAGPAPAAPALQIRYAHGPGASRLALATAGGGTPLLVPPAWCSNLAAIGSGGDPRSPLLARLAARHQLPLYDRRGTGLSAGSETATGAPAPDAGSLDDDVAEALAALDALGIERAAVLGVSQAGPVALALAARHPARVDRLVLVGTYASGPRAFPRADLRASLLALVRAHWGMGAKLLADMLAPGASAEELEVYARVQRQSATPELAAALLERIYAADVSDLLPRVRQPVLVAHFTDDRAVPFAAARELAAALPAARLVPLPGRAHLPRTAGELDAFMNQVEDFWGEDRG